MNAVASETTNSSKIGMATLLPYITVSKPHVQLNQYGNFLVIFLQVASTTFAYQGHIEPMSFFNFEQFAPTFTVLFCVCLQQQ